MNASLGSTVKSSWTPLKKGTPTNEQLFEERRALLFKWWQKWSNDQRILILHDLLNNSKVEQKTFAETHLKKNFPARQLDFTRALPRHLSLYIFSFLDPRSLCRCSQVCWFWKYLTEEDTLWMVKCLRFGWDLDFKPTPFEVGIWKKNYIRRVEDLVVNNPADPGEITAETKSSKDSRGDSGEISPLRNTRKCHTSGSRALDMTPPPWKANDRKPTDIVRYNFLDNDDANKSQFLFAEKREKALQIKQESTKKSYGSTHGRVIPPRKNSSTGQYRPSTSHHQPSSSANYSQNANDVMKSLTFTAVPRRSVTSTNPQLRSILRNSTNNMSGSVAVFGPDESVASVSGVTGSSIWGTASLKHEPAEKESDVTGESALEAPQPSSEKEKGALLTGASFEDPREKLTRSTVTNLVSRSNRDPPSHDLFPTRPWKLVNADDSD